MFRKRKLLEKIISVKDSGKIIIIVGPRQSGKTTLLKMIQQSLKSTGSKMLFLDLDIFSSYEKIATYENILNTLKLHGFRENQKKSFFLFLDEFQRHKDVSIVLKNLYDHHDNIKIFATGSSSLTIKDSIQESLAGRKFLYRLYPLDFEEFLNFKEDKEALELFVNANQIKGKDLHSVVFKLMEHLKEFIIFGGYPEVALSEDKEEKKEILRSIFDLYVKKELIEYLRIENVYPAKLLIEYLAVNNGQKIQYEKLSQISGVSQKTAKNYIEILKETFLIHNIRPYFTNRKKELVKIPKIYFIDTGVSNYFINNFERPAVRNDMGFLFETFIFGELIKSGIAPDQLKFWGDKNKHEVDLIIENQKRLTGIEVKYKEKVKEADFSGLKAFKRLYETRIGSLFLINTGQQYLKVDIQLVLPFRIQKILQYLKL